VHCIYDKPNGIIINHDGDWSGNVRVAWYLDGDRHDPGPTLPVLGECWCTGPDLVAGRFTPVSKVSDPAPSCVHIPEPPIDVITRTVALAVESYLRSKMENALADLFIKRSKL
jgi:hypothetical protein